MMKITMYTDGACSGNPGPMGVGGIILMDTQVIHSFSTYLRQDGTNNLAEYLAIETALDWVLAHVAGCKHFDCDIYSDSKLAVNQLNGEWAIHEKHLAQKCWDISRKRLQFNSVSLHHVLRNHPWIVCVDRSLREVMIEQSPTPGR